MAASYFAFNGALDFAFNGAFVGAVRMVTRWSAVMVVNNLWTFVVFLLLFLARATKVYRFDGALRGLLLYHGQRSLWYFRVLWCVGPFIGVAFAFFDLLIGREGERMSRIGVIKGSVLASFFVRNCVNSRFQRYVIL